MIALWARSRRNIELSNLMRPRLEQLLYSTRKMKKVSSLYVSLPSCLTWNLTWLLLARSRPVSQEGPRQQGYPHAGERSTGSSGGQVRSISLLDASQSQGKAPTTGSLSQANLGEDRKECQGWRYGKHVDSQNPGRWYGRRAVGPGDRKCHAYCQRRGCSWGSVRIG